MPAPVGSSKPCSAGNVSTVHYYATSKGFAEADEEPGDDLAPQREVLRYAIKF